MKHKYIEIKRIGKQYYSTRDSCKNNKKAIS